MSAAQQTPALPTPALSRFARPNEVPMIDFAPLARNNDHAIDAVAREVDQACREVGFFTVVNHPVPAPLIREIFAQSRRFFAQPLEAKLQLHMRNSPAFRGYLPMDHKRDGGGPRGKRVEGFQEDINVASPRIRKPNKNEVFQISAELGPDDPTVAAGKPLYGPNQWPAGLPGFRETILDYFDTMTRFSALMASLFARALDLERDYFQPFYTKPLIQLRLLHYLPQDQQAALEGGDTHSHCDAGGFTMLQQDDVGGLEIKTRSNDWILVPPVENAFVINIGDSMKMWTNGRFASTLHRVVNHYGRERYSVGVFANPNYDTLISPLPGCVDAERPPVFQPMVAGDALLFLYSHAWPSFQKAP